MSNTGGRSYSDGQTVKVKLGGAVVAKGEFVYLEGWFGLAEFETTPDVNDEIGINVFQGTYVTSQIEPADAFARGTLVYFNAAAKLISSVVPGAGLTTPVGKVVNPKDPAGTIEFKLGPQG